MGSPEEIGRQSPSELRSSDASVAGEGLGRSFRITVLYDDRMSVGTDRIPRILVPKLILGSAEY